MTAVWIIEVESQKRWAPIIKHPLETTLGDMGLRQEFSGI
jgi:hypothetical protein